MVAVAHGVHHGCAHIVAYVRLVSETTCIAEYVFADPLWSLQRLLADQGYSSALCIQHVVLRTFAYHCSVGVSQFHVDDHVEGPACGGPLRILISFGAHDSGRMVRMISFRADGDNRFSIGFYKIRVCTAQKVFGDP